MTKTSIFGQSEVKQEEKKPIDFLSHCVHGDEWTKSSCIPNDYDNILLLQKNYTTTGLDLMWAYDDDPNYGVLYLGHWNDGIVK